MSWEILKIDRNPLQSSVTLINRDRTATHTTDYQKADALARKTLTGATLFGKGTCLTEASIRVYVSQAY